MCFFIDGADYDAISETLTIPAGSASGASGSIQCQNISIVDNNAFEKSETFFVYLSSEPNVQVPDPNVTVTILDDEGMFFRANIISPTINECVSIRRMLFLV